MGGQCDGRLWESGWHGCRCTLGLLSFLPPLTCALVPTAGHKKTVKWVQEWKFPYFRLFSFFSLTFLTDVLELCRYGAQSFSAAAGSAWGGCLGWAGQGHVLMESVLHGTDFPSCPVQDLFKLFRGSFGKPSPK